MKKTTISLLIILFLTDYISAADHITQTNENMIFVSGGTFNMGSIDGADDEQPVHSVTVNSFYMSKYELTQGEYQSLMGINPSATNKGIGSNYPVNQLSWYEMVEYCNTLSRKEGLTEVYSFSDDKISMNINANGYRLPTEAEWEFAARGGNYSREYTYSGSNDVGTVAWTTTNRDENTHPVGDKEANELGIFDMSGNVWEWCWDWYSPYISSSQDNPVGISSGSDRVIRGGSWCQNDRVSRSSYRNRMDPSCRYDNLGFRLVRRENLGQDSLIK